MKTIASLSLINSAFALRFYDNGDYRLSQSEVENQLNPFIYGRQAPNQRKGGQFSDALEKMARGENAENLNLDFLNKKSVVIQPDNINETNQQKLDMMNRMQADSIIHYTNPEDIHTAAEREVKPAPLKQDWKSNEFVGKFGSYIDDKDLADDLKISSGDLARANINL